MRHSTGTPTKAQQRRFRLMQERVGCIACYLKGHPGTPGDVHHLVEGNRRIGHDYTIVLCPWHHRGQHGVLRERLDIVRDILGPSLALNPRAFRETFGTERELLARVNELLGERSAA